MNECLPLNTFEDLLEWGPHSKNRHRTASLCLRGNPKPKGCPKTLVCHDMKGGYLEDRFVHGINKENCFSFIHWSFVDIFVYFSHSLITIPPCGWITAAHRNGTQILGTFITEWEAGSNTCAQFLCDAKSVGIFCDQLVLIAVFYGFDGWLLNIENEIKPDQVPWLEHFVRTITEKMHFANENSVVIWYDSVINTGQLKWQNALNDNNRIFFDCCDGIFLNYNWKEEDLAQSVRKAGFRRSDVYVGVDVFGRGCLGGGGFCTDIAVKAARNHLLSVAIFAPGWVFECLEPNLLLQNHYKFWDLLSEFCLIKKFHSLPFSTSFCPGFGLKMYRKGKVISHKPWYNMSLQQPQSSFHNTHDNCSTISLQEGFDGGGCLLLQVPMHENTNSIKNIGIFSCSFIINESCLVSYASKTELDAKMTMVLNMKSFQGSDVKRLKEVHLIDGSESVEMNQSDSASSGFIVLKPAASNELVKYQNIVAGDKDWIVRTYFLDAERFQSHIIENVSMSLMNTENNFPNISVQIGYFKICKLKRKVYFNCNNVETSVENGFNRLKCLLEWNTSSNEQFCDLFYEFSSNEEHLVTTSQQFFNVDLKFSLMDENSKIVAFHLYPTNCESPFSEGKLSVTVDL